MSHMSSQGLGLHRLCSYKGGVKVSLKLWIYRVLRVLYRRPINPKLMFGAWGFELRGFGV